MTDLTCIIFSAVTLLLLSAAVFFLPVYLSRQNKKVFDVLRENLELTRVQLESERQKERDKILDKVRMQAYERMTLFLERIRLTNLLTRANRPGQKAGDLHAALLMSIREEFDHNMSQQLYLSDASWELIKSAKEEVIRTINMAASGIEQEEESGLLVRELLSGENGNGTHSIARALAGLKKDLRENF